MAEHHQIVINGDCTRPVVKKLREFSSNPNAHETKKASALRLLIAIKYLDKQICIECGGAGHRTGDCGYRKKLYDAAGTMNGAKSCFNQAVDDVMKDNGTFVGSQVSLATIPLDARTIPRQIGRKRTSPYANGNGHNKR